MSAGVAVWHTHCHAWTQGGLMTGLLIAAAVLILDVLSIPR